MLNRLSEVQRWHTMARHNEIAGYSVFVESGTSEGYTTQAMLDHFSRLVTIEFDTVKYHNAARWALHEPRVDVIHGDSSACLEWIREELRGSNVFFWLDAHYNEGWEEAPSKCPVLTELAHIFYRVDDLNPIVFIDDARLFGVEQGYPEIEEVAGWAQRAGYSFENKNDILRIYPSKFQRSFRSFQ